MQACAGANTGHADPRVRVRDDAKLLHVRRSPGPDPVAVQPRKVQDRAGFEWACGIEKRWRVCMVWVAVAADRTSQDRMLARALTKLN
jgi:hypothetical protein